MTDAMRPLRRLMEKSVDADVLRERIGFTAERLMELEVGGLTGAARTKTSAWSGATATGITSGRFFVAVTTLPGRWLGTSGPAGRF